MSLQQFALQKWNFLHKTVCICVRWL